MASSEVSTIIKDTLKSIAGDEAVIITNTLLQELCNGNGNGELTEEELANKSSQRIQVVRKTIYKLDEYRLINSRRVKEKIGENQKGLFVFFLSIKPEKIIDIIKAKQLQVLRRLRKRLMFEKSALFFYCTSCKERASALPPAVFSKSQNIFKDTFQVHLRGSYGNRL